MTHRASPLAALVLLACALGFPPLEAQAPAQSDGYARILVESQPGARVVAAVLRFPTGHADDARGREGTGFLLGRVLEAEGNRRLGAMSARVEVSVERDRFQATLLADPEHWEDALRDLEALLYRDPLSPEAVARERGDLLDRLLFEEGAPVRSFEVELSAFLRGATHPGARPPRGTRGSVQGLDEEVLSDFRASHLVRVSGEVAVSGPVEAEGVGRILAGPVRPAFQAGREPRARQEPVASPLGDTLPSPLPPAPRFLLRDGDEPPLRVPPEPRDPPIWTEGGRELAHRDLTSMWISAAYPLPAGTPWLLAEFATHLLMEALTPTPPDPGLFGAEVSVEEVRGTPVLLLSVWVDPRTAGRWEERVHQAVAQLAERPPEGSFFQLTRRRFRSALVLELGSPEARAGWILERASPDGTLPDPEREVWRLTRDGVSGLILAAGPSRTLLFGPGGFLDP